MLYEFLNCALWPDFVFHPNHRFYFCFPNLSIFARGLFVLHSALCWPSHSQSSLHSVMQFLEHCLPQNFCLPRPCLQASSFSSQFLLTPVLLSLVSTWHLSRCFQARVSSPCLFLFLFKVFFLLLLSNIVPSLYRFFCKIRAVLASLFQHEPLSCCLFMLLLTVHHHIQQKQSISWWQHCENIR